MYFEIFEKKVLKKFFGSFFTKSLPKTFTFQLEKVKNDENFRILQNASYGSEMTPERFRSVLRSRNTSFPPHITPTHALKNFFQNRFWPLEKRFLLIYAWESLKTCHFRGSYLELFRPNDELPECFLADLNSLGVYLKLVRATFLIYVEKFEKKVLKMFFWLIFHQILTKTLHFSA